MESKKRTQENSNVEQFINEERSFIHDLSSPLMIAAGMTDLSLSMNTKKEYEKSAEKLIKAQKALSRMSELLKIRRKTLIDRINDHDD